MNGTVGALPRIRVIGRPIVLIQTLHVVGRRANVTAEQRPGLSAVQASVQVEVGVELAVFGDFDVLVADHVGLVDNLAAGYEAVWLVKGEWTHRALEEVGVAHLGLGAPSNALTSRTHVERAREATGFSLVK
jgi:hypothetical protein